MKPDNSANWVYVMVQDPEAEAQILGQQDTEHNIAFIPVFNDKDAALGAAPYLVKQPGHRYEAQAILYEDLVVYAREHGFLLFFIDDHGKVVKQQVP